MGEKKIEKSWKRVLTDGGNGGKLNKLSQRATDNDKKLQKSFKKLLTKRNGYDILNKLFRTTANENLDN